MSQTSKGRKKVINDPIHGHIELDDYSVQIIDTVPFQRLRNLRQLGSAYFVFPGASHNRFEHCIGVCYLAGVLIEHLREVQPDLDITDQDVKCVKLAGLCHDLGHGPFSHVFDNEIVPRLMPDSKWCHEDASENMLDFIVKEYPDIDISPQELRLIKDLIHGKPRSVYSSSGKSYLFDIVANKRNSIDVDKYDYIQRDCYNVGIKSSLDTKRLMKFTRVIDNQICYDHKEAFSIYELFHTRYSLFKRVYSHRVSKAIEYMLTDVFIKANDVLKINSVINDMSKYQYFNDCVLSEIERSDSPTLKESRDILYRLRRRDLYAYVDALIVPYELRKIVKERFTASNLYKECQDLPWSECSSRKSSISKSYSDSEELLFNEDKEKLHENELVREDEIIIEFLHLGYAMKDQNPVDNVRFYNSKTSDMYSNKRRNKRPSSKRYREYDSSSDNSFSKSPLLKTISHGQNSLGEEYNDYEEDIQMNDSFELQQQHDENLNINNSQKSNKSNNSNKNDLISFQIRKEQISGLIPNDFEEVSVRIFVKRRSAIEEVHKGFLSFVSKLNKEIQGQGRHMGLEIASTFYH